MNAAVITQFPDRHLRGGNAETLRCAAERIEGSLPASRAGAAATLGAVPLDAGFPIRHKAITDRQMSVRVTPDRRGREAVRSATETELARG
jgi:hypothetical protein